MAEIIPFGKRGKNDSSTEVEQPSPVEASLSDAEFLQQHRDLIERVVKIESDFADMLESLDPGVINNANVELRREGMHSMSLQQLCHIWLTSRETDWKMKPSFYAAAVIERYLRTEALGEKF